MMVTENTYDSSCGLLLYTDITVNGSKQRVSKVSYDDLGRISSVVRGDGTQRGYRYTYNGYGWLILAEYAEGETLSSNKDRYTERFLNFMPNTAAYAVFSVTD